MTNTIAIQAGSMSDIPFRIQAIPGSPSPEDFQPAYTIGTGGASSTSQIFAIWRALAAPLERKLEHLAEQELREQVAFIQHYLSLSISDLARVAGVKRPTIYAWIRNESTPRRANMERLTELHRAASVWKALVGRPMGRLSQIPLVRGVPSVVTLLETSASEEEVRSALEAIAERIHATRGQTVSVKERLAQHGLEDKSEASRAAGSLRAARRQVRGRRR